MKNLSRLPWILLAVVGAYGLFMSAKFWVKWPNLVKPLPEPQGFAVGHIHWLIPTFSNYYGATGVAPTQDGQKNVDLFVHSVTNRFVDFGTEPPPEEYKWWPDMSCYLFLPAKLESNVFSILLLAAAGTNSPPDFWVAVTHYRGVFDVVLLTGYSEMWRTNVQARPPDMYFWMRRSGYLRHKQQEAASETQSAPTNNRP